MDDNKKKLSSFWFFIIGFIASTLIGLAVSYLLLGKTQPYRENHLWKYTILSYFISTLYTIWYYFSEDYLPILINLFKFIGLNLILSLPYFFILIFIGDFSINSILTILPAQIIYLAGFFIWHVACKIDPRLENNLNKYAAKNFFFVILVIFIATFSGLPEVVILALTALTILGGSLSLLKRAKKYVLKSHNEHFEK